MEVIRDGSTKTLNVTVKSLPGNGEVLAQNDSGSGQDNGTLNGVGVSDLNQEAHDQFKIPDNIKGAVITQVDPSSAAAQAGLKAGDVIQEINRHPVSSAEDAIKLTEKTDTKRTLVRVWENGGSHYVVVDESSAG
jgi:serine protease Do